MLHRQPRACKINPFSKRALSLRRNRDAARAALAGPAGPVTCFIAKRNALALKAAVRRATRSRKGPSAMPPEFHLNCQQFGSLVRVTLEHNGTAYISCVMLARDFHEWARDYRDRITLRFINPESTSEAS